MFSNIKPFTLFIKFISPPEFENNEKARSARLLNTISLAILFTSTIFIVFTLLQVPIQMSRLFNASVTFSIALLTTILIRLEYVKQASIFIAVALLVLTTGIIATTGGISAPFTGAYIVTLLIAGMLLGRSSEFVFGGLCLLLLFAIYRMDIGSYLPPSVVVHTKTSLWIVKSLIFIVVAVILNLAVGSINRAREALKKNLKRFEGLLESDPDGVMIVNEMGKIELVNKEFENLFGYERNEVIGKPMDMFIPSRYSKHVAQVEKYMKTPVIRSMYTDLEIYALRKNGTEFPADISLGPLKTDSGVVVFASIRDITERRKVEDELAKHRENLEEIVDERTAELKEVNSVQEMLFDIVSHDLINPAGQILGFSELLMDDQPDNEHLQYIHKGSSRLVDTLKTATSLIQATQGEDIKKKPIDFVEMIKGINDDFAQRLKSTEMKLELDLPKELAVDANPIISQVPINFISNAIRYARDGKKIIVKAHKVKKEVIIEVRDFGTTIPKNQRTKVFERKTQLDKEKKRGRGLGLAIVKRIAEAHKAEVGVRPNTPTGNIFYIKIPVL
ncbi:MAG: PAS domain-containing sensor histidine kinase [Candidatus Neomarinimicrobiota bacterium]